MEQNYTLVAGVLGGLIISQAISYAGRFYDLFYRSEHERTETLKTHITDTEKKMIQLQEDLMEQIKTDIDQREMVFEMGQRRLNKKLALVLQELNTTTSGDKYAYKTSAGIGMTILEGMLEKADTEISMTYKKLLDDVASRDDVPEPVIEEEEVLPEPVINHPAITEPVRKTPSF
jgi:hypothetical protein